MMPDHQSVLIIVGVDGLEPAVPLGLLGGHGGIVTPSPVTVFTKAIGAHHPDKLGNGIDQDTQLVFGLLFVMNIGAGANVFQDRTLRIFELHGFDKEPAVVSSRSIDQALFHFIWTAGLYVASPPTLYACP